MINETSETMHLAAQYLAAANINFVAKESDDSHTNLGFNIEHQRLETHVLSPRGNQLALNYKEFSLEWISLNGVTSFSLDGKTHSQILEWLQQKSLTLLSKSYAYDFHYDLPYAIDSTYLFRLPDTSALEKLSNLRILTQNSLERIILDNDLEAGIRVWPHHFDTGIYTNIKDTPEVTVGMGLAIPDTVSDGHYFYISGYRNGDQINTSELNPLSTGNWISDTFQGGILPAKGLKESEVVAFYQEALDQFQK